MRVAEAAIASLEQQHARARLIEIGDQCLVVFFIDLGPDGHLENSVSTIGARHLLSHAIATVFRRNVLLESVVDQGVEIVCGFDPDVTAAATIATIGSTEFDELFPAE